MSRYKVHIEPLALTQIRNAISYIRDELCMSKAAQSLLDDIQAAVMGLERMPKRFRIVCIGSSDRLAIRRMNVRKYAVFYVVNDEQKVVRIFAVLYGSPSNQRISELFSEVFDVEQA